VKVFDVPLLINSPLAFREADQEAELVARLDLSRRQGDDRSVVDTIFHRILDVLGNIEEVLLEMLTPSVHVTGGGVRGLAECLQLCLQF
jgi:hypothetical protein